MNILQEILKNKKLEIEIQKSQWPDIDTMQQLIIDMPAITSFLKIIEEKKKEQKIALIAEVKKASPSKGLIKDDFKENFNHVEIAQNYKRSGASAISVLTDEKFFQGSIKYLEDIRKEIKIPILRKDFIIDEFQIYQTRLMKADVILLIASALGKEQFNDYYQLSNEIGLDVLVEVHNEEEMERALDTEAKLIGINNRNLDTFEVSIDTTIDLIKDLNKNERFFISESGISTNQDILKLYNAGASGVLVGESLIKQDNIESAIKNLLNNKL